MQTISAVLTTLPIQRHSQHGALLPHNLHDISWHYRSLSSCSLIQQTSQLLAGHAMSHVCEQSKAGLITLRGRPQPNQHISKSLLPFKIPSHRSTLFGRLERMTKCRRNFLGFLSCPTLCQLHMIHKTNKTSTLVSNV